MKQLSGRSVPSLGKALLAGACLSLACAVPAFGGEAPRLASKSAVGGRGPRATAAVPEARARAMTALQFAAVEGLTYSDRTTYVLLEAGAMRLRIYPGSDVTVVGGREFRVKDPFVRSAGDVVLSGRVTRFLSRQVSTFRAEEASRRDELARQTPALPELPPLPERRHRTPRAPLALRTDPIPAKAAPAPRPALGHESWVPGVSERPWKWIVIHHSDDTSGNMAKYDAYHRNVNGWENGCGYHFVIGNGTMSGDGQVEMGPRWGRQLQGAHAKVPDNRYNERGIGICLVGDFHNGTGRPSHAQMDSLVELVQWLKHRYGIADADVHGHCDCCSTACPGKNFPWSEFRRRTR